MLFFLQRESAKLVIVARDNGKRPKNRTVDVKIDITQTVNAYPQWVEDYSARPIQLPENVPVNYLVKRLKAYSNMPDATVNYVIQPGETAEQNGAPRSFYTRIDESSNEMLLYVYRALDFETIPKYTLTIRASVSQLLSKYIYTCLGMLGWIGEDFLFLKYFPMRKYVLWCYFPISEFMKYRIYLYL